MAKRDRVAETLDLVARLRDEIDPARAISALRGHLEDKNNLVVAKAVQVTRERSLAVLGPDLVAAYERFIENPTKADPGCVAKTAIVAACVEMAINDADLFRAAIRTVQMEASYGGPVDVAARLRGHAAYGLLNARATDAFRLIGELLADRWPEARHAAIRALGTARHDTSAALLRFAARVYAEDPDTLAEVFSSLVGIDAEASFEFVASFLELPFEGVPEVAALAVGESRHALALDTLLKIWRLPIRRIDPQMLFTAFAVTRRPEAVEFLIERIRDGRPEESKAAADSLRATMRSDADVQARVAAALSAR